MGFNVEKARAAGYTDEEIQGYLESKSVDTKSGGSFGDRLGSSFKMTNAGKVGYLESKYGKGNAKILNSGEVAFKNPQTGQWTQLDSEGFDLNDITDFAGDVPSMVGSAIGAGVGASAAGVGSVYGAAAGAAGGNVVKQAVSKLLPGDDNMTLGDRAKSTAIDAGLGGVGQKVGNMIGTALSKNTARQLANSGLPPVVNIQVIEKALDDTGIQWRDLSAKAQQKARDYAARSLDSGAEIDPKMLTNKAILESLPVPIKYPSKGQLSQDFYQQQNENMLADIPVIGRGLRDAFEGQNATLAQNLDEIASRTGAATLNPRQVGQNVQGNLLHRYDSAKASTKAAYDLAEAMDGHTPTGVSDEFLTWLEQNRGFQDVAGVVHKGKALGLIAEDPATGALVSGNAPLRNLYELRKTVSNLSKTNGAFGDAKSMIDDIFDGSGSNLYQRAAGLRRSQGQTFEQGPKVVSDLVKKRANTTDQFTNPEDLFNRVVINGSRDDVRNLKAMLLKRDDPASAQAGWQALKDLRGRTIDYLKENAVLNYGGGEVKFNVGGLESAVKKIGQDNLEELLGKKGAKEINTLVEAARLVGRSKQNKTVGSATAPRLAQMALNMFDMLGKIPGAGPIGAGGKYAVHAIQGSNAMRQPTEDMIAAEAANLYGRSPELQTLANLLRSGAIAGAPQ